MEELSYNLAVDNAVSAEQEETKEEKKYTFFGQEISLAEKENIVFQQNSAKMLCSLFMLIGRFDENGKYTITDDVKRDLVRMPKEIRLVEENLYTAHSVFMKEDFEFKIVITEIDQSKVRATLYLEEDVGEAVEGGVIATRIADFVDEKNENFRIKVRKVFNLLDLGMPVDEMNVTNISVILQRDLDLDLVAGDLYDIASQIYLMRMLKLLEKTEKGREVIREYKNYVQAREVSYKRMNAYHKTLLDRAINNIGGTEKLDTPKEETSKAIADMNKAIQLLTATKAGQAAVETAKPSEGKSGGGKSGGGKSAGGKSGGGKSGGGKSGGGKTNKKKSGGGSSNKSKKASGKGKGGKDDKKPKAYVFYLEGKDSSERQDTKPDLKLDIRQDEKDKSAEKPPEKEEQKAPPQPPANSELDSIIDDNTFMPIQVQQEQGSIAATQTVGGVINEEMADELSSVSQKKETELSTSRINVDSEAENE